MNWLVARLPGTQFRGLALILLLVVPMFAVTTNSYLSARAAARDAAHDRAMGLARLAAKEYAYRVEAARQLLIPGDAFAGVLPADSVFDRTRCSETLADLMRRAPGYSNLFALDANGDLVCSGVPNMAPVNAADRDYFRIAMQTRQPSVGAPVIGRVSNRPSVIVGYPVADSSGRVVRVLGASIDLGSIVTPAGEDDLPSGTTVTVIDRQGTVIARNLEPERWVGKVGSVTPLLPNPFTAGGTAVGVGDDGVSRLYAVVPLTSLPSAQVMSAVYVGIPTTEAYGTADAAFLRQLAWLTGMTLLVSVFAWFASRKILIVPLNRIAATTEQIAAGDFEARTGITAAHGEIGLLAASVDQMAGDLARVYAELERERNELDSVLSSAPNVVALTEEDGTVIRINAAIERVFGYTPEDLEGHSIHTLFDALALPSAGGDPVQHPFESIGTRADGSRFALEVVIRPVEGEPKPRFVVVLIDATTRKAAEAARELERVSEARLDVLCTLNHQLRSPLNVVLGFGELLEAELRDERQRHHVGDMMDAARHMLALVNDLLDFSRIDAGHWDMTATDFDAVALVHDVTEPFEAIAAAKGLALSVGLPATPAMMHSDARALREILTNLTDNAVKYTDQGTVSVHLERRDDLLEVRVTDTGIGIASKDWETVFEPFVQLGARGQDQEPGTGLGLPIARRLARMLGGDITISSTPERDTIFTVRVPVTAPASPVM